MSDIYVNAEVSITPYRVVEAVDWDHDSLIEFVLGVDSEVGELDFTIALRDKLNEIIEEEQK